MMSESMSLEPIIQYPATAQVGQSYLLSVDFKLADKQVWTYEDEEYPLYVMLETLPLFSHEPLGEGALVLHRFGGSYGAAQFLLTAGDEVSEGVIRVHLLNRWGVEVQVYKLETEINLKKENRKKLHIKVKPKWLNQNRKPTNKTNSKKINSYISQLPLPSKKLSDTKKNWLTKLLQPVQLYEEFKEKKSFSKNYSILSSDYDIDVSHGTAKRYSANVLVNGNLQKDDFLRIIIEITEKLKKENHYRNDITRKRWKKENAHVIWLFLYFSLEDKDSVNWICKTQWVSKNLPSKYEPMGMNGEDIGKGIFVDWNKLHKKYNSFVFVNIKPNINTPTSDIKIDAKKERYKNLLRPHYTEHIYKELQKQSLNVYGSQGQGRERFLEDLQKLAEADSYIILRLNMRSYAKSYINFNEELKVLLEKKTDKKIFLLLYNFDEILDNYELDSGYDVAFFDQLNSFKNRYNYSLLCITEKPYIQYRIYNKNIHTLSPLDLQIDKLTTLSFNEISTELEIRDLDLNENDFKLLLKTVNSHQKPYGFIEYVSNRFQADTYQDLSFKEKIKIWDKDFKKENRRGLLNVFDGFQNIVSSVSNELNFFKTNKSIDEHMRIAKLWSEKPLDIKVLIIPVIEEKKFQPSKKWLIYIHKLKEQLISIEITYNTSIKKQEIQQLVQQLEQFKQQTLIENKNWRKYYLDAIDVWQQRAKQELQKIELQLKNQEPITVNIYLWGNALNPEQNQEVFLGRKDLQEDLALAILTSIEIPMILIQGQRRTGKTSLLNFLEQLLGTSLKLVRQDLQNGDIDSIPSWLNDLQQQISQTLELQQPARKKYDNWLQHWKALQNWLVEISQNTDYKLILAFDEYEGIHELLQEDQKQGCRLLAAMRSYSQHQNQIVFWFVGTTLFSELENPNWSEYFVQAQRFKVDYLKREDALRLITEPVELNYPLEVVEQMYQLTQGHPALLQLLCSKMVTLANQELRKNMTQADLDKIINEITHKREILVIYIFWEQFCKQEACKKTVLEIINRQPINDKKQLYRLEEHGFIIEKNEQWQMRVPLFEMWLHNFAYKFGTKIIQAK